MSSSIANQQTVITGFINIATTITAASSALPPTGQMSARDELAIKDTFHSFTTAQTTLLGTVRQSAAGALAMVPVVGPSVASALKDVSTVVHVSCPPLLLFCPGG